MVPLVCAVLGGCAGAGRGGHTVGGRGVKAARDGRRGRRAVRLVLEAGRAGGLLSGLVGAWRGGGYAGGPVLGWVSGHGAGRGGGQRSVPGRQTGAQGRAGAHG